MTTLAKLSAPAKAGAQSAVNMRDSASGAQRRVWTPAFAGEQEGMLRQ